ncbi:MAG TPA: hypothetical protein VGU66_11820 [Candidatus Elarobacter sp.]|nr:hypothetical protein [Candidatus Elarobacter sp.]
MAGLDLSKFEWVALFAAVQTLVLLAAAGIAFRGARIAYKQLKSYESAERAKNTIQLFQEMDRTYRTVINFVVRPGRCRQYPARNVTRACNWLIARRARRRRNKVMGNFIQCAQFFDRIAIQYEKRTISRKLYLDRACALTIEVYAVLSTIDAEIIPGTYDLTEFTKLARACQIEYRKFHARDEAPTGRILFLRNLPIPRPDRIQKRGLIGPLASASTSTPSAPS